MRSLISLVTAVAAALAISGCASFSDASPTSDAVPTDRTVRQSSTFSADPGPTTTYDEELVPAGSAITVTVAASAGTTTVTLEVSGLPADRSYGAHAHTGPCGKAGADAGPHFQFEQDPVTPSVDPAYANSENEIWLDFTTDAEGVAAATATVGWVFPDDRQAESVIIHTMPTATGPGEAGVAGDRAACASVDF